MNLQRRRKRSIDLKLFWGSRKPKSNGNYNKEKEELQSFGAKKETAQGIEKRQVSYRDGVPL